MSAAKKTKNDTSRTAQTAAVKLGRRAATVKTWIEAKPGEGHRSHLDRRYWISVNLDADVPAKEIKRLVSQSYDLVCANLTGKQRAELERIGGKEAGLGVTDSARSGLLSRSR